jgi:hypothetical protein
MEVHRFKGLELTRGHYFTDKFVLFAGTLERCSRRDAMDMKQKFIKLEKYLKTEEKQR